jgi:CBS domain containing-hemolysin-like protein
MIVWIFFGAAAVLVALGGLLAACDAALGALSRADVLDLATQTRSGPQLARIAADPGTHANALNFLRIVSETTAAVLVTLAFIAIIPEWWITLLLATLIMTGASFVLVGSSPRSVGRAHARGVLRVNARLIRTVRVLVGPIAKLLVAIGDRVTPGRTSATGFSSEEQLLSMVDEATEQEVLEEVDRELIHSIFEFGDTVVREVMIPRTDMVSIDGKASVASAIGLFLSRGVSRIPVLGKDADEVLGVAYLRDVARLGHERPGETDGTSVLSLAKPALFVPESQKADDLLRQMQAQSNHLAMVVDEYGGIAGLVTMEDLIEELVGDIADESDRQVPLVEELGDDRYRVSARLPVGDLGELFGLDLDDDDVDSVGGLLTKALGRLPISGDIAEVSGLRLAAERTEGRRGRISTILVVATPELEAVRDAFAGDGEERK